MLPSSDTHRVISDWVRGCTPPHSVVPDQNSGPIHSLFVTPVYLCLLQPVLHQALESTPIPSLVPSNIASLPSAYLWALAGASGSRLGVGMCPHGLH